MIQRTHNAALLVAALFFLLIPSDAFALTSAAEMAWNGIAAAWSSATGEKTYAMMLFEYSMGSGGSCLSCTFLSYFMYALAEFSYIVYLYFWQFFFMSAPVAIALWLGYRVAKLMIAGGEDGRGFIVQIVSKLALFTLVWVIAMGSSLGTQQTLWQWSGPYYLDYAFRMSNGLRDAALTNLSNGTAPAANPANLPPGYSAAAGNNTVSSYDPLIRCDDPNLPTPRASFQSANNTYSPSTDSAPFVKSAIGTACFTERAHIMGIATGVAVMLNANYGTNGYIFDIGLWIAFFVALIIKVIIGVLMIVTYSMSAVWAVFLTLDVVTRGLLTAAFAPVFAFLYLFQPTRGIATSAVKAMAGALVTAVTLSIISVLSYVLITNTTNVYENTKAQVHDNYENITANWGAITASDPSAQMAQFLYGLGLANDENGVIPMDFGSPWFWYMVFCGIALYALGKKIMAMLKGLIGDHGQDAFADAAQKAFRMGGTAAIGAGAAATLVAAPVVAGVAAKGSAAGLGAAAGATKGVTSGVLGQMAQGAGNYAASKGFSSAHALSRSNMTGAGSLAPQAQTKNPMTEALGKVVSESMDDPDKQQ